MSEKKAAMVRMTSETQEKLNVLAGRRGEPVGETIGFLVEFGWAIELLGEKQKGFVRDLAKEANYPEGVTWANLAIHELAARWARWQVFGDLNLDGLLDSEGYPDGTSMPYTGALLFQGVERMCARDVEKEKAAVEGQEIEAKLKMAKRQAETAEKVGKVDDDDE